MGTFVPACFKAHPVSEGISAAAQQTALEEQTAQSGKQERR